MEAKHSVLLRDRCAAGIVLSFFLGDGEPFAHDPRLPL